MTKMLFYYKNDHDQQKKGDWQTRRIAITLLTISLSLELRRASVVFLTKESVRLDWWDNRQRLNE
jgi:hypothetical protein